jgi:hypothetical protein
MDKTWRRAIQKYGSLGAISFEKAFSSSSKQSADCRHAPPSSIANFCGHTVLLSLSHQYNLSIYDFLGRPTVQQIFVKSLRHIKC